MINVKKRIVSIDELSHAVAHMQRQFIDKDSDENLASLPISELSEIVYEGEKIALSCRQAMEEKGYEKGECIRFTIYRYWLLTTKRLLNIP